MTSQVLQVGGWYIDGRDLDNMTLALRTALAVALQSSSRDGGESQTAKDCRRLLGDAIRAATGTSATEAAEVARTLLPSEWVPKDLITIKEAANLMRCSESNVRQMTNRQPPTLSAYFVDGLKRVSAAECAAKRQKRGA